MIDSPAAQLGSGSACRLLNTPMGWARVTQPAAFTSVHPWPARLGLLLAAGSSRRRAGQPQWEQARSGREGDFITGRSRLAAAQVPISQCPLPLLPPDFVPGR